MVSKLKVLTVQAVAFLTTGWMAWAFPGDTIGRVAWKVLAAEVIGWLAWAISLLLLRRV